MPMGRIVRLYPVKVLLGATPDDQPMLQRADGGAAVATGGTDTLVLSDPFAVEPTPVRGGSALLRAGSQRRRAVGSVSSNSTVLEISFASQAKAANSPLPLLCEHYSQTRWSQALMCRGRTNRPVLSPASSVAPSACVFIVEGTATTVDGNGRLKVVGPRFDVWSRARVQRVSAPTAHVHST
jgi:hypothetical protein